MTKLLRIPAIALLLSGLMQCSSPEEISQWRGPNRNGIYPEKNLLKEWPENGPKLLWKYEDLGMGYSSAAVTSKKVYTTGTSDSTSYLYAFNHDGNLMWKKELGPEWVKTFPGVRSTPLIYGENGYVVSGLGVLTCFNTETGAINWTRDFLNDGDARNIQHGITENLIVDGDKIFCCPGGTEYNVVALNRFTGDLIWKSKGNGQKSAYCSPLIIERGGKKFLITMMFNSVVSLDVETGVLAWSHPLTEPKYGIHVSTPYYRDGRLFVIEGWQYGCRMLQLAEDGLSAEEVWHNKELDMQMGDAVVIGDKIYGGNCVKHYWCCLDWTTGETLFTSKMMGEGAIISADDMFYCYSYMGEMGLVKPNVDGYELVSSFVVDEKKPSHHSYPVIKDGKLYLRHQQSLWVYDITEKG